MQDEYRIERIAPSMYPHLVELYHLCFGIRASWHELERKYDTSAFGARDIGFIAFAQDGSPAAYYGVFATRVEWNGSHLLAAQSGDTMTAPAHQRKGLFIRLARETYALAKRLGVAFVFGFPNENSLPGFRDKLGWVFDGYLQDIRIRSGSLPFCEIASRATFLQWSYDRLLSVLFRGRMSQPPTAAPGDGLAWQTRDDPFSNYKRSGGAFWIRSGPVLALVKPRVHMYVGDLILDEGCSLGQIREGLRCLGRHAGAAKVILTFSENHPLFARLREVVPPSKGLPIGFLELNHPAPVGKMVFTRADLDTF